MLFFQVTLRCDHCGAHVDTTAEMNPWGVVVSNLPRGWSCLNDKKHWCLQEVCREAAKVAHAYQGGSFVQRTD